MSSEITHIDIKDYEEECNEHDKLRMEHFALLRLLRNAQTIVHYLALEAQTATPFYLGVELFLREAKFVLDAWQKEDAARWPHPMPPVTP